MGMEDDPNFNKLPTRDRDLHRWAEQLQSDDVSPLDSLDMLLDCLSQADAVIKDQTHPLEDRPLVDVTPAPADPQPGPAAELEKLEKSKYEELQTKLLSLSTNSKRMVAKDSGHPVIIDRPDIVIDAIDEVVSAVRNQTKL